MSGGVSNNKRNRSSATPGDLEAGQNPTPGDLEASEEMDKERRDQIRHLEKEASQLANYYFEFQGVIFTAFYNTPSSLKCEYRWIPFTLSFIAGFLNLCALTRIAFKYKSTLDLIDKKATSTTVDRGSNRSAADKEANEAPLRHGDPIAVKSDRHWRCFYVVSCLLFFVGFFVITLIGCWKITCGGGKSANAAAPPSPP